MCPQLGGLGEGAEMAWGQPDQRLGQVPASAAGSWLQLPALNPGPAIDAAGESHYQDTLEAVGGGRTCFGVRHPLITAELVREPANPYDPNAVRIDVAGRPLAHVPKEDASRFHAVLDKLAGQGGRATLPSSADRRLGPWSR
jgi:hypothetical protein